MSVAVVLPYRATPSRETEVAVRCIRAWLAQDIVSQVVLVDSSREPLALWKESRLTVVRAPYAGPINLSFMRNVGMRRALELGMSWVHFTDADLFPADNGYVARCLAVASQKRADIVRPLVHYSTGVVPAFRTLGDPQYQAFVAPARGAVARIRSRLAEGPPARAPWLTTSALFLKPEVSVRIGGHDEAYVGWGGEDDDYFARAEQCGFRAVAPRHIALVHSYHVPHTHDHSKSQAGNYAFNLVRLRQTEAAVLPSRRMPADWGQHETPRPEVSALNA